MCYGTNLSYMFYFSEEYWEKSSAWYEPEKIPVQVLFIYVHILIGLLLIGDMIGHHA